MFEDDSNDEDQIGKPKNTKRTELVALNGAMEFQEVSATNNQVYRGLDDWLVGFVKFTVDVRAMNSDESKQKKYLEKHYKVRSLSPSTIKTYVNALAAIYNTRRQENQCISPCGSSCNCVRSSLILSAVVQGVEDVIATWCSPASRCQIANETPSFNTQPPKTSCHRFLGVFAASASSACLHAAC